MLLIDALLNCFNFIDCLDCL